MSETPAWNDCTVFMRLNGERQAWDQGRRVLKAMIRVGTLRSAREYADGLAAGERIGSHVVDLAVKMADYSLAVSFTRSWGASRERYERNHMSERKESSDFRKNPGCRIAIELYLASDHITPSPPLPTCRRWPISARRRRRTASAARRGSRASPACRSPGRSGSRPPGG